MSGSFQALVRKLRAETVLALSVHPGPFYGLRTLTETYDKPGIAPRLEAIVITPFTEVARDIAQMIGRVNARFERAFNTAVSVEDPKLGWHATPNGLRNGIKADRGARFAQALATLQSLRKLRDEAQGLHDRILFRI